MKIKTFLTLCFVFTLTLIGLQTLSATTVEEADYKLIASKSGLVEQTDFAPIELSLKNNTDAPITIGNIDVQRVNLPADITIEEIPQHEIDTCKAVIGATDETGPSGYCINMDGEWYRNTLSTERDDVLPQPTIQPGETAIIAEISTGMPTSWRGWYGGGWVDLISWITIDGTEWRSEFVRHFITEGETGPHAEFKQDNGDGTATFIVENIESGLTKENFQIYQRIDDRFEGVIGTIISVTETSSGVYEIIWRHLVANHNGVCISADNNQGDNVLDYGNIETVTISSTAIPRDFKTTDNETIESNIGEIKDLANTEKEVSFSKSTLGKISFAPGLNLFDSRQELERLSSFLNITYNEDSNSMKASVDTKNLTFLANHGASIQFFNIKERMGITDITSENFRNFLDITVFENNTQITENLLDYFDWDNVSYDEENDILTLPVNHFTEYVLSEKTSISLPETGEAILIAFSIASVSLFTFVILKKQNYLS